jgi:hypothetical protein
MGSFWPSLLFARPGRSRTAGAFFRTDAFLSPASLLDWDPFGNNTVVSYDAKYTLLLVSTRDAVGNVTSADHDYRVLQPKMVTDPNDNRTEVRFDALGMLAGIVLRGTAAGPVEGDSFDAFVADLTPDQIRQFFDAADPRRFAITHLGTATTRILYDLDRVPVCAAAIARETHVSDLRPGTAAKVQSRILSIPTGSDARRRPRFRRSLVGSISLIQIPADQSPLDQASTSTTPLF